MSEGGLLALLSAMQPHEAEPLPVVDFDADRELVWNQGFAAGREDAVTALVPLQLQLTDAAGALRAACVIDAAGLRPVLAELVRGVAEAVLMAELEAGAHVLIPLVDAALAAVVLGEAATLKGHPETLAALQTDLPGIAVIGDAAMARDGFVVTGTDFVVEVGLGARLFEIMKEIL